MPNGVSPTGLTASIYDDTHSSVIFTESSTALSEQNSLLTTQSRSFQDSAADVTDSLADFTFIDDSSTLSRNAIKPLITKRSATSSGIGEDEVLSIQPVDNIPPPTLPIMSLMSPDVQTDLKNGGSESTSMQGVLSSSQISILPTEVPTPSTTCTDSPTISLQSSDPSPSVQQTKPEDCLLKIIRWGVISSQLEC